MLTIAKVSIFRMIQIAWSPTALVGYILFVIKLIMFSRKSGVSSTTLASLYTRWMQHKLGTRLDEPCERLMMVLPNVSHLALRTVTGGTLLAHRLTGYVPRTYRYPYEGDPPMAHESAARTTFFDAALARHLENIDQLVLLGAGYDTRSYRIPTAIRCFEIDTPKTQEAKRQALKKADLDTTRMTFVAADFMTEDWLEKLVNAGNCNLITNPIE
jgi:Leucine carboxyl methyltransferase